MIKNLKGIVIDAGHGGSDPGATSNGIVEKDLTLKIATYIANRLKSLGLPVTLTRDTDITLEPKARVNKILSSYGNDPNVLVISNHINAGGGDGAEVIYAIRNDDTLAKIILDELKNSGQNVRKVYQRKLPSNPKQDYYFIHRETGNTEPIIIEYGFIDSKGDDPEQLKNNYETYAEAVVRGITKYLNIPYETLNNEYYIVKSGDTLYSVAAKNNMTVSKLKEINNLTSDTIKIGDKLLLVEPDYIVKKGDTLYSIATKNNLTVNELKELNNLTNDILFIGQKLKLNKDLENEIYVAKKGDTLYSIAKKYNISVNKLKELNNLNSNLLSIGQSLIISKN